MNETITTLVGNIGGGAPELRFTPNGVAVAKFRMACTPRKRIGEKWVDGEPSWFSVTVWRDAAEHVVESLSNGDRVIVYGALSVRSYEDKEGVKRTSVEVDAYEVGASMTFAEVKITKAAKSGDNGKSSGGDAWGDAQPAQTRRAEPNAPVGQAAASPDKDW